MQNMRNRIFVFFILALLLGSCGTSTGDGAYVGSNLGSILGSAIGGIANGPRGSDIGTVFGLAGGAAVGAVIGNAIDQRKNNSVELKSSRDVSKSQDGVVDESDKGDDRLYDFNSSDYTTYNSTQLPVSKGYSIDSKDLMCKPLVEIRNARFIDDNMDGKIQRGELSKIIFEVINNSSDTLLDVQPLVTETTCNRHIKISPGMHIESILPGNGIRYTALVLADQRLSFGNIKLVLSVFANGKQQTSPVEFQVPTLK